MLLRAHGRVKEDRLDQECLTRLATERLVVPVLASEDHCHLPLIKASSTSSADNQQSDRVEPTLRPTLSEAVRLTFSQPLLPTLRPVTLKQPTSQALNSELAAVTLSKLALSEQAADILNSQV